LVLIIGSMLQTLLKLRSSHLISNFYYRAFEVSLYTGGGIQNFCRPSGREHGYARTKAIGVLYC